MNKSDELRNRLDELSVSVYQDIDGERHYAISETEIAQLLQSQTLEAENKVIEKAHSPCECGSDHFATPVRSVQGGVTTYCQFRRVRLSELNNQKKGL